MSVEQHEIVIVGGGIAGLSAAWSLRERDVCVLEAAERVGGRLKSEVREPYWLNLGAHVLKLGGPMATLAHEVGVPLIEPSGHFIAVAMKGRIVRANSAESMLLRLPLSPSARISLAQIGLRMRVAEWRAGLLGEHHPGEANVNAQQAEYRTQLDSITFAQFLGAMHPEVVALMRVIANRLTGELEEISAWVGVEGFSRLWLASRLNIVGGSAQLALALQNALGAHVQTGARVTAIHQGAAGVEIAYTQRGEEKLMHAQACIVSVPAPLVRELIRDLPAERAAALDRIHYTPFVVAGMFTNEMSAMPWDDLYALAVPGRSFCMFFNPGNALRTNGARQPRGSLVVYSVAQRAAALLDESDASIRDRYLADLYQIFPQARGIIDQVIIQKWRYGTATGSPGRRAVRDQLAQPWGRVFFAGDYMMEPDAIDASESGRTAARAVKTFLDSKEFPIRLAAHQQSDENGVARFHRRQRSDVYLVPRVRKGV
ncbi:MAG TPA: NAD(P)/FAD-dependent oxidoreductase [Anaerolineae bacterium]|nr:NAD(P)/FAD-dependent oxidoreductase [Anaerolineae bacterium]